jgi:hypothetical protein
MVSLGIFIALFIYMLTNGRVKRAPISGHGNMRLYSSERNFRMNKEKILRSKASGRVCIISTALLLVLSGVKGIFAQASWLNDSREITALPRPLAAAADQLQRLYGKPVTYEDPILMWQGDKQAIPNAKGNMGLIPTRRDFTMPVEVDRNNTSLPNAELLVGKVVNAYHAQTDGPRFSVSSSTWGMHIIPAQVRDADGHLKEAKSLLDGCITVPTAKRTPEEHLHAICAAVTASTGIALKGFGPWLNEYYAPSNVRRSGRFIAKEEIDKISFVWGATNMIAREAVVSFLEHSSTTLSWRLLCELNEGFCVFNMGPVEINFVDPEGKPAWTALDHDREKSSNPK